jgi:2-methylcitrate dehydratase PrpD
VNEAEVQSLLRKVRVVPQQARDAEEPLFSPEDRLTVRLRDGTELDADPVHRALGHASRPIGEAELRAKFFSCAGFAMEEEQSARWWDAATAPLGAPLRWPQAFP